MTPEKSEIIYGINGPIVYIKGTTAFEMNEMVYVGEDRLVGEVISLDTGMTSIQVFEETTGLKPGEKVTGTGGPITVTLGPGILDNIYDGIQRPLMDIARISGNYVSRGISVTSLDENRKWNVSFTVKPGDIIYAGNVFATCPETPSLTHRVMLSPLIGRAEVISVCPDGEYTVTDNVMKIRDDNGTEQDVTLAQRWPIRVPRPVEKRLPLTKPLVTGQRIFDTLFPVALGGSAAIPGGFGTGKTMTQHAIAKHSQADVIVYIGCGERGNEMTEVLEDFGKLTDPRTGNKLMARTVLIANTSNMPVAAREASIYTGVTIAEYYRDMGYNVAVMADSTSRWAEALREISGRMEEMPAEEGYPAYLASRLSAFYERAGAMRTLSGDTGSVTIIGAVSPQGGDFSEPVTRNTRRCVRCFWALDKQLAYMRHYFAINWMLSYSEYSPELAPWYNENVNPNFVKYKARILSILHKEDKIMETVKLIGEDVLPDDQRLILEVSKVIRTGFLQQNAFHKEDCCVPLEKQYRMMEVILYLYDTCSKLISIGHPVSVLRREGIFEKITAIKFDVANDEIDKFDRYLRMTDRFYDTVMAKNM